MMIKPRRRLMVAFVALAATMFTLLPAGPASATPAQLVVQGNPIFNPVGCGSGSFEGTANGNHGGAPVTNARVSATYEYCSTGVEEAAAGRFIFHGTDACNFSWQRTVQAATAVFDCDEDGQFDDATGTAFVFPDAIPVNEHMTIMADITNHDSDSS